MANGGTDQSAYEGSNESAYEGSNKSAYDKTDPTCPEGMKESCTIVEVPVLGSKSMHVHTHSIANQTTYEGSNESAYEGSNESADKTDLSRGNEKNLALL